jgi:hypothetical protein
MWSILLASLAFSCALGAKTFTGRRPQQMVRADGVSATVDIHGESIAGLASALSNARLARPVIYKTGMRHAIQQSHAPGYTGRGVDFCGREGSAC